MANSPTARPDDALAGWDTTNNVARRISVSPSGALVAPLVPHSGEYAVTAAATQLPSVAGALVRIKPRSTNTGSIYLGAAGVTAPDGTTDATTGMELVAGDDTGWMPVGNLNVFYVIGSDANQRLTYMVLQ